MNAVEISQLACVLSSTEFNCNERPDDDSEEMG